MPRVFICYRRVDAPASAGRLFDRLTDRFGRDNVFMDVDTIRPGQDYAARIDEFVGNCDALVAVIGRRWLEGEDGERRIDEPGDYVRLEIEAALARGIQVLPVLVEDGAMPGAEDLPPELAAFAGRQATEVSQSRFGHDAARLADAIEGGPTVAPSGTAPGAGPAGVLRQPLTRIAAVALVVVGIVLALVLPGGDGVPDESFPDAARVKVAQGRTTALEVFEAWQNNDLASLDSRTISAGARRTLSQLPIAPILPIPAGPGDCYPAEDDVDCRFLYRPITIGLIFRLVEYPTGLRVADVSCISTETGEPEPARTTVCAELIAMS